MIFQGKGTTMGRKKRPEPDDKEQAARFIEAAKRIEEPLSRKGFEGELYTLVTI